MPAEGSGGDPAAVTVPHGAEPAAAASGEPTVERVEGTAAAAAEPGGSGPLAWLLRRRQRTKAEWHRRVGSLGLSAVLAYGMLDGLTSAAAFVLAFLAYEAQTGVNLAHNPAQLPKVMLLVWASKHVTRPFRWAAVAALAPLTDRLLNALQQRLRLQSRGAAFALCVAGTAACCLGAGRRRFGCWVPFGSRVQRGLCRVLPSPSVHSDSREGPKRP